MSLILDGTNGLSDVDGSAATPAIRGTDANTGIFFPAADTIAFSEGGAEAMRLDASGNLGLGVTPSAYGTNFKAIQIGLAGNVASQTGARTIEITSNAYNNSGWKYQATDKATLYYQYDGGHAWSTAASGTAGNAISFTQAMTLDSSGNLLVGGTLNTSLAGICCNTANGISIERSGHGYRQMYMASSVLYFYNGSNQASLSAAGAWTNASDVRLKNNIEDIKYGLNTVLQTQPRSYKRIDVEGDFIGFVAQELKTKIPEVVFGSDEENDQYTVDYGSLVAVAFKAIQEQQAIIESLKARLDAANL